MTTHLANDQRTNVCSSPRASAALAALLALSLLGACNPHEHSGGEDAGSVDAGASVPLPSDSSASSDTGREPTARPVSVVPSTPTPPMTPAPARDAAAAVPTLPPPSGSPHDAGGSGHTGDAGVSDAGVSEAAPAPDKDLKVAEVRAEIVGHHAAGTLCPSDSTSWSLEPGAASSFSVQLGGELNASDGDAAAALLGSCTLTLDLALPAGLRLGNPDIAFMPVAVGAVELTTHYTFVAGDHIAEHTRTLTEESSFSERGESFWSPPCTDATAKQRVQLVIELRAVVPVGSYLGAFLITSGFTYEGGAEFRTCGGELLAPEPAGSGARCAVYPKYPCASHLTCDLLDDRTNVSVELRAGTCVDPKSTLSPQPLDAACGGARNVACSAGLVCHYSSAARAALRPVGICAKAAPAYEERCGGSPELVCTPGLYCGTLSRASDAMYCQEGGGEQGARCGDGLAACAPWLTCNAEVCTPKLAGRGERCGERVAVCGHLDLCSERTRRCVEDPDAGALGARCISNDECDRGLSCREARCTQPSSGELGSACRVPNDCSTGLTCRLNLCSQ